MIRQLLYVLLGLYLTLAGYTSLRSEVYAVVVGVNDYRGAATRLRSAVSDARNVYNFFRQAAPQGKIVLLTDNEATKERILATMREVFTKAGPDDLVLFFFSGHGLPGYFCPTDVGSLGQRVLAHSEIRDLFKTSRAQLKLCLADACYSGSIQPKNTAATSPKSNSSVVVLMSSRPTETSIEANTAVGGTGLFTKYLVQGMRGAADKNNDRAITLAELYRYMRQGIRQASNNQQTPVLYGNVSSSKVLIRY